MRFGYDYGPELVESLRKHLKGFRTKEFHNPWEIGGGFWAAWESEDGKTQHVRGHSPDELMEAIIAKLKELKEKEKPKVEARNPYKRKLVL